MNYPKLILSNKKEDSIIIQRVYGFSFLQKVTDPDISLLEGEGTASSALHILHSST